MSKAFFDEEFYPDLANMPIRGEYMEALADYLEANADQYQELEEEQTADNVVMRTFAHYCRQPEAIANGFTINEADAILAQIVPDAHRDIDDAFAKMQSVISSRDAFEARDFFENLTGPGIKYFMSLVVAAQEKNPDAYMELYELSMEHLKGLECSSAVASQQAIERLRESELEPGRRESFIEDIRLQAAQIPVSVFITEKNINASLPANSPIRGLLRQYERRLEENLDREIAEIFEIEPGTKTGDLQLAQKKKLLMSMCAADGISLIDNPLE